MGRGIGRRGFLLGTAGVALAGGAGLRAPAVMAQASTYPSRSVRFIVPLAAGGGLDFVARILGEYLQKDLGQSFVIENRTGAGGTIGIDAAIKSPPDGYTILVTNDNIASAPHVMQLNVDYLKDMLPVAQIGRQPQVLAVHPSFEGKTVADLVTIAKANPKMGCATSGVGSNQHVLMEWFCKAAGIRLDHVPYRGAGQAINDLLAGHVKIAFLGPTAVVPHADAKTLRVLAQSGDKRMANFPDVPTLQEAGYKEISLESWYAVFAPMGTPPDIVNKLNAAINKAVSDPATKAAFYKGATEALGSTTDGLAKSARGDSDKYKRLVAELNVMAKQ